MSGPPTDYGRPITPNASSSPADGPGDSVAAKDSEQPIQGHAMIRGITRR
jgi:hypothetical protein